MSEPHYTAIDAHTRVCAVYGHPVAHSASPAMQNAAMAELGLNWRYLACDVHPDALASAIAGAKAMRFLGLNLTLPHKLLAVSMVDVLDESGRKFNAINTIRFEGLDRAGAWQPLGLLPPGAAAQVRSVGFNTDADAIIRALREDVRVEPREASILLVGLGGAGSVAALRLAEEMPKRLYLVNRTLQKAEELRLEIYERFPNAQVELGYPAGAVDLLLNATSLGLRAEDPLPYDPARLALSRCGAVYDMIYRPAETKLLMAARAAGCRVANGLGMLLYQGAKALEIWANTPPPISVMRRALESTVYGR